MIRKAEIEDRENYINMSRLFYSTDAVMKKVPDIHFSDTFDEVMKNSPYAEIFIFEENGKTAGYALTAKTFSQEAGGMCLWLEEIFVLPEYRGKGFASGFISEMKKRKGFKRMRLEVEKENEKAVKLYKRCGFDFFLYDQMINE